MIWIVCFFVCFCLFLFVVVMWCLQTRDHSLRAVVSLIYCCCVLLLLLMLCTVDAPSTNVGARIFVAVVGALLLLLLLLSGTVGGFAIVVVARVFVFMIIRMEKGLFVQSIRTCFLHIYKQLY